MSNFPYNAEAPKKIAANAQKQILDFKKGVKIWNFIVLK